MKYTRKQIARPIGGSGVIIAILAAIATPSTDVTSTLTLASSVAGFNGTAIPVTNSLDEGTPGYVIAGPNMVEVYDFNTKKPIYYEGKIVYGRLTFTAGVYRVSYFYRGSTGNDTAYQMPVNTTVDLVLPYRFSFETYPTDNLFKTKQYFLSSTVAPSREVEEALTVTGLNSIGSLSSVPVPGTIVKLIVRGKEETNLGATASFSLSGNSISWNQTNAGYPLEIGDGVIAKYKTLS